MEIEETNGSKATIREVFDLVKPMAERQVKIETTLNEFIKVYEKSHKALADDLVLTIEKNTTEHKNIVELIQSKISIKAFSAWLTGASVFIGIVITMLKIFKVM